MSDAPDESKLAQADALAAEAMSTGEETTHGRELRTQAAKLRVDALGERSYPVLICSGCLHLTGWTTAEGLCDSCTRRARTQAAYADPHGGFVVLDDVRQSHDPPPETHGGHRLLGRLVVGHAAHDREHVLTWLLHVDPGRTGPVEPEPGFEVEVAHRDQLEAVDGSGLILQFRTASHRYTESAWVELPTTRARREQVAFPTEQAAALPAEQLVEAWLDYRGAVTAFNRSRWAGQSEAREAARVEQAEREDARRRQAHASDLLDES